MNEIFIATCAHHIKVLQQVVAMLLVLCSHCVAIVVLSSHNLFSVHKDAVSQSTVPRVKGVVSLLKPPDSRPTHNGPSQQPPPQNRPSRGTGT